METTRLHQRCSAARRRGGGWRPGQPRSKWPALAVLVSSPPSAWAPWTAAFQQRLRELNWIDGRNITIEHRRAEGRNERGAEIAAEFARLKVDVIITTGSSALAVKEAIATRISMRSAVSGNSLKCFPEWTRFSEVQYPSRSSDGTPQSPPPSWLGKAPAAPNRGLPLPCRMRGFSIFECARRSGTRWASAC